MEIKHGCVIEALHKGDINVLAHVTNCQGVKGRGIAKSIKDSFPDVYKVYKRVVVRAMQNDNPLLGRCQLVPVETSQRWSGYYYNSYVATMFAQDLYGRDKRHLNYGALAASAISLQRSLHGGEIIGIPYLLGCDRSGGDWEIVSEILDHIFGDKIVAYKLEEKK